MPTTGLTSIGDRAFQGAFTGDSALKTLSLPSSVTSIGSNAFQGTGLTSIDLSSTQVTTINPSTFQDAASLNTVKLPVGLTTIRDKAFYGTTALKTLTQGNEETSNKLAASITSIGTYAFQNTGLTSLDLKDTTITDTYNNNTHTTHFGNSIFQGATSLMI